MALRTSKSISTEVAVTDPEINILAESESFSVWRSDEPDGEMTYHLELGNVTLHLFREELDELLNLMRVVGDRVGSR
jgi:hypothetical protein